MRVLLIEDNEELATLVVCGLAARGFPTDHVTTAVDALSVLGATHYAALILDLSLPDGDGLSVLRQLRSRANPVPVLVLTARTGVHDRVVGLRSGADDYLTKPFAFDELVARLEAILRRPGELLGRSIEIANLIFDTQARQLFIDRKPHVLSGREAAVLELLMRRAGRVVSKKLLEDQLFGFTNEIGSNAVEVYVHRLRKQLSDRSAKIEIHTLRGVGYLLSEQQR